MKWDFEKNECCRGFYFERRKECNRYSPEECMGETEFKSERTEVYHLGNVLNALLTKSQDPYNKNKDKNEVEKMLLSGKRHHLPPEIDDSSDPAIQAIIKARNEAYTFDINARPSARDIANILDEAYLLNKPK